MHEGEGETANDTPGEQKDECQKAEPTGLGCGEQVDIVHMRRTAVVVPDHAGLLRIALGIGDHDILVRAHTHRVVAPNRFGGALESLSLAVGTKRG